LLSFVEIRSTTLEAIPLTDTIDEHALAVPADAAAELDDQVVDALPHRLRSKLLFVGFRQCSFVWLANCRHIVPQADAHSACLYQSCSCFFRRVIEGRHLQA
jgi:hypothetical protein